MDNYTVRPLGKAAWESNLISLEEAKRSAAKARDLGLESVVIVDECTGEIVDEHEGEE